MCFLVLLLVYLTVSLQRKEIEDYNCWSINITFELCHCLLIEILPFGLRNVFEAIFDESTLFRRKRSSLCACRIVSVVI